MCCLLPFLASVVGGAQSTSAFKLVDIGQSARLSNGMVIDFTNGFLRYAM